MGYFYLIIEGSDTMAKVILLCGKICAGKSYYAKMLKDSLNAVVMYPDEATYELINNEQGEFFNVLIGLKKGVASIISSADNVITSPAGLMALKINVAGK